jgi:hypothetical protein
VIKIVILDKGFVSVGVWTEGAEWSVLDNAQIVRYWGTTRGLGEIAKNGPTPSTKLDPTPRQRFPNRSIVNTIECDVENWAKVLGLEGAQAKEGT